MLLQKNDVMSYSTPNWLQVSLYNHTRGVLYCKQLWIFAKALSTGFHCVILGMEDKHCFGVSNSLCLLHLISKNNSNYRGYKDATPLLHHMCSDLKCHDDCTAKIWKQSYILMQRCDDWVKEMTALIVSLTVIILQLYFLSYLKTPKSSIY